jgi:glycerophosphoryl diester phosphodiesterase
MMAFVSLAATLVGSLTAAPRPFDLQGHRGARGLAPENTLVAFARALTLGVTTLELDLAVTKDGVVVVSHDPLLNRDVARAADGRWLEKPGPPIHSLTRAELAAYDVGRLRSDSAYARQFPAQVPVDGTRIPELADIYALAKKAGNDEVRFNIETKIDPSKPDETPAPAAFVDAVVKVVRAAKATARTTIQSFDWRTLRRVHDVAPEIETVCLTTQGLTEDTVQTSRAGASPWLGGLDVDDFGGSVPRLVQATGCKVWSPNARNVDREKVAEAHALGLKVIPWTVNAQEDMRAQIDLGVDGLITDRPDVLRSVMQEKGLALPRPTPVEP